MSVIHHSFSATFSSLGLNTLTKHPFIQRGLGNRNCFSATSKRGSLIFTQGLLELSESVATIKMGVDSKDTKGSQRLPKERDLETPLYPKRAQKWFSVLSVSGEERTAPFHQVFAVLDEGLPACCLRSTFFNLIFSWDPHGIIRRKTGLASWFLHLLVVWLGGPSESWFLLCRNLHHMVVEQVQ